VTEPDVALTNYFLAAEAAVFVVLLISKRESSELRFWFSLYFGSLFTASLCGGTVHGFFSESESPGHAILWSTTLLALGMTSLSAWAIGAKLLFSRQTANWLLLAAVVQLVFYVLAVLTWTQEFWVVLLGTMPAMFFLMVALGVAYRREGHWTLLAAAAGIAFTFLAGVLQHLRIGLHPDYLSHNAFAHVVQSVALFLLFLGANHLVRRTTHAHTFTT
jgi:hypothetical protein